MKKLNVLFVTIILGVLTSSVCLAGQKYISGFAGVNFPVGSDFHITNNLGGDNFRVEQHDSNFTFGGAFGYDFGNDFRIEEEIAYRDNDVDPASLPLGLTAQRTTLSFMTNGYFDIDLGIPLKPYLGAGIGFASIEREVTGLFGTNKDKDTVLAYQLMAGLGFEINPMITITVGYRYFLTSGLRFHNEPVPGTITSIDDEFQSHEFMGGIRVTF